MWLHSVLAYMHVEHYLVYYVLLMQECFYIIK